MTRLALLLQVLLLPLLTAPAAALDAFDRHTSFWLQQAVRDSKGLPDVTSRSAAELKPIGEGLSPCLVVQTAEGNLAKLLVTWGYRKAEPRPMPVLMIERFVTYDGSQRDVAKAAGRDVMLFPGFEFDLDIGQVVPAGQGGDLTFNEKARLAPLNETKLHALSGPAIPGSGEGDEYDPLDHDGVLPRDFSGTWQVDSDGRWRGVWQLSVDDEGNAQGKYISSDTQSAFPIIGHISGLPHRLVMEVRFGNSSQLYELFLWTKDKAVMAGTTEVQDRKFGVYAVREQKKPAKKTEESKP